MQGNLGLTPHSVPPGGGQIQTGAFKRRGEICDDAGLHADAAGRNPRKTRREATLLMDQIKGAKDLLEDEEVFK